MSEPNILLTRIDNRLIHGQVATQWNGTLGANLILVANNKVAGDKTRQGLMDMAAPAGVQTRYFTLEKTIEIIHKAAPRQKIFIICENPEDVLTLVRGGVPIKKLLSTCIAYLSAMTFTHCTPPRPTTASTSSPSQK